MKAYQSIFDLISILEYEDISIAIKKLQINKNEITKLLMKLTKELDCEIGVLDKNKIHLTPFGEDVCNIFKKYAQLIPQEIKNAVRDSENIYGVIRILTPHNIYIKMPLFFQILHSKFPLIKIEISFYDGYNLPHKLLSDFDIVIHYNLPETSLFYLHKITNLSNKFYVHKDSGLEKEIFTPEMLLEKKYLRKVITTEDISRITLIKKDDPQGKLNILINGYPLMLQASYRLLLDNFKLDSIIFSIEDQAFINNHYIDLFPQYEINGKELYVLRNKFNDSAIAVTTEKLLKEFLIDQLRIL